MSKIIKGAAIGAASALAMAAATSAHAVNMRAGDTELSVYGYAQLNASYDFDVQAGDATASGFSTDFSGDAEDGFFDMDATQSRIGFTTRTPAGGDTVMTNIEGDFRGGALRLRHAYGSWNGILAGQTWSNFNSFTANPSLIDFNGANGATGVQGRNAQIRYTTGGLSVAAEEMPVTIIGGTAKREMPDISVRFEGGQGGVGFTVAGAMQRLEVADVDSATGVGAFAGVNFEVVPGTTLTGSVAFHDGVGQYFAGGAGSFYSPNAVVDGNSLDTVESIGAVIGLSQAAGAGTFNLAYAWTENDYPVDDAVAAGWVETRQSVFANYMWSPAMNVTYGFELSWRDQELVSGDDADATRAKFMARYSF